MFVLVMMSMRSVPVAPRARMRVVGGAPQQAAPTLHCQASNYQQDLRVKTGLEKTILKRSIMEGGLKRQSNSTDKN
jgi:hypothetical protein